MMDLRQQFENETGKRVNGTVKERLIDLQYSLSYVLWLENKVLESTKADSDDWIKRKLGYVQELLDETDLNNSCKCDTEVMRIIPLTMANGYVYCKECRLSRI